VFSCMYFSKIDSRYGHYICFVFGFHWLLIPVPVNTRPRNDMLCVKRHIKLYSFAERAKVLCHWASHCHACMCLCVH